MRAIVHVDGDAFFASCEVAQNERLRGRPVVTGEERGMAIAVSYEAKARGVSRGMLMRDIRKLVPDVVILGGHYDIYKIYSRRMSAIMRRYAPIVEEYSIDECFADLTSLNKSWNELVEIARNIKHDLEHDLGMTFSLGLAPTKVLAKVASKCKKPAGFTAMQEQDIADFLESTNINKVWGIGPSTSQELSGLGIKTALDFINKDRQWVENNFSKPTQEIWYELRGIPMHEVGDGNMTKHKSIRCTGTFRPPSKEKQKIILELSQNAENACARLRKYKFATKSVYFFLKTQNFMYSGREIRFDNPVSNPVDIIKAVIENLPFVFKKNTEYRATGIVLQSIVPEDLGQTDLFGQSEKQNIKSELWKSIDNLGKKLFFDPIMLASSFKSPENFKKAGDGPEKDDDLYHTGILLGIPSWGQTNLKN